ncbi:MAG: hypothetical protein WKF48_05480, partial [Solirubrobacteraceae bacterium]
MTDFIDGLECDLVDAAARQSLSRRTAAAVRRRRFSGRGLAVTAAALVVAGAATAAVVSTTGQPSKPLAGPVREAAPNARVYAISLHPDLRAGQAGWCASTRFTIEGRSTSSGTGCGYARATGGNLIAASGVDYTHGDTDAVEFAIVTSRVRTVRFADRRLVATRSDRALPYRWRIAVKVARNLGPGPTFRPGAKPPPAPVPLDEAGTPLPGLTPADHRQRGARSRLVTRAEPARRCVIGRAEGFRVGYARVAQGSPRLAARLEGRAFFSCASTVFHTADERSHLTAAILLDALDPKTAAGDLPPSPKLSGRRLGPGWIAVHGGTAQERARLLN